MTRLPASRTWSRLVVLAVATATIALGACGADGGREGSAAIIHAADDGYAGTLVTDPPMRPADVVLRDTDGRAYPLDQFGEDEVTALFFGFTHCDDVCPTTMADLAAARRSLPASLAERVEVVFVTVDPARDTAPVLDRWLGRFDPTFVGLRGPLRFVHQAEDSLYASQSTVEQPTGGHNHESGSRESSSHGGYEVTHSGLVYVFAPGGRSLVYTGGTTAPEYADDFALLLKSG